MAERTTGEMGRVTMARRGFRWLLFAILGLVFVYAWSVPAEAQVAPILPRISIGVEPAENPEDIAISLQILVLLTILALAPAILIMMTSFTRIVVVLSFVRNALATQQMPPNQVLIGLALFLTFYVMAPTWQVGTRRLCSPLSAGRNHPDGCSGESFGANPGVHVQEHPGKGPRTLCQPF